MARKKKTSKKLIIPIPIVIFLIIVCLSVFIMYQTGVPVVVSYVDMFFGTQQTTSKNEPSFNITINENEDIRFHFLELGHKNTGDATYIQAGDVDILIDAGSVGASATTLTKYIDTYCKDGKLEYVIVTHGHEDHVAGFAGNSSANAKNYKNETTGKTGIFYYYDIGTIIDFSMTNSTSTINDTNTVLGKYYSAREYAITKGATHFTAKECRNETNGAKYLYNLTSSIQMTILDQKYYYEKSSDENDHSVCTLFTQATTEGTRHYLLTGDLEEKGEESLVTKNNLPKVELYKGGHHGSPTSSNDCLLNVIQPKYCAVCCCAGSNEYTSNVDNQFPAQAFINRLAKWTEKIFVTSLAINDTNGKTINFTSLNGNIIAVGTSSQFEVSCSNNNIYLKDTEWFNRDIYVQISDKGIPTICKSTDTGAVSRKMRTWPTI